MLGRHNPSLTIKVDVIPCHAADLVPALPSKGKEFDNRTEWKPYRPTTHNHGSKFFIRKCTMP